MYDLDEIKELCAENGISNDILSKIVSEALKLRDFDGKTLDDSQMIEMIKLSIENYDVDDSIVEKTKSVKKTVELSAHKLFDKTAYTDDLPDYDYSEENRHI